MNNPENSIGKLLQDEIYESLKKGERPDLNKVLTSAVVQLLELTQKNHEILQESHQFSHNRAGPTFPVMVRGQTG